MNIAVMSSNVGKLFESYHWSLFVALAMGVVVLLALPSGVAAGRRLPDRKRIYALNVAGLVAFSCWFAALGWAVFGSKDVSFYDALKARGYWFVALICGVLLASSAIFILLR